MTHLPLICRLYKASPSDEFGFNLHAEKGGGHFIGLVDSGGIGDRAGLKPGQQIVGVNGVLVHRNTTHNEVVGLMKKSPMTMIALVASEDVVKMFSERREAFSFDQAEEAVPTEVETKQNSSRSSEDSTRGSLPKLDGPPNAVQYKTPPPPEKKKLNNEEEYLNRRYEELKAKFDDWQLLTLEEKNSAAAKQLQKELIRDHDLIMSLLRKSMPKKAASFSEFTTKNRPSLTPDTYAPRLPIFPVMRSPLTIKPPPASPITGIPAETSRSVSPVRNQNLENTGNKVKMDPVSDYERAMALLEASMPDLRDSITGQRIIRKSPNPTSETPVYRSATSETASSASASPAIYSDSTDSGMGEKIVSALSPYIASPSDVDVFYSAELTLIRHIERGGQASVQLASTKFHRNLAVKYFDRNQDRSGEYGRRELVNILRMTAHPNIVHFRGILYDNPQSKARDDLPLGYLMEYMADGSLHSVIHSRPRAQYGITEVLDWTRQAASALCYLHSKSILHRDVKPANMLLCNQKKRLKLCDFGLSSGMEVKKTADVGTVLYMAPEVMSSSTSRVVRYDANCDVYSLAVSLWEIIHRSTPFADEDRALFALVSEIRGADALRPIIDDSVCPRDMKSLIETSWAANPANRTTMDEIHSFVVEKLAKEGFFEDYD